MKHFSKHDRKDNGSQQTATLNVCTLSGRSCELVAALVRRSVDLCAVQKGGRIVNRRVSATDSKCSIVTVQAQKAEL